MTIAILFFAVLFAASMGFFAGGVGRVLGELLIKRVNRKKPLPRAASISIRVMSWLTGCAAGVLVSWQRFFTGMSGDGSSFRFPNVPRQELWLVAFVLGFVLLYVASEIARRGAPTTPRD
jgi:hypothetical protein